MQSEKVSVEINEKHGRHLVASLDLEPGDTILEETPLFVTPHWDAEQMKCSNCFHDSYVMCNKCNMFPLCMDCKVHDDYECSFFCSSDGAKISKNLLVKNYPIFATLKLLLMMENPKTAPLCSSLQLPNPDLDVYRNTELWFEQSENIVIPLMKAGIGKAFKNLKIDEDFLQKLCILIDAYAFELSNREGDSLKGIFIQGAQLPHNCVPNTVVALDEDFNLRIYAAVPIKSGEVLYNSYSNPLMGTSQRQHHLRLTRHIQCECPRCLDPTELGTHMSSMKCQKCDDGYSVCDLHQTKNWICLSCKAMQPSLEVHKLLADVGEAMVSANGDLKLYENLLVKYSSNLHPNHFLLIDMKQNIATILRAILMSPSVGSPKKLLARRLELCEEILPVARAVIPGISKLYAIALFEYLMPFLELAELEYRDKDITMESFYKKLKTVKEIASEALGLLAFEPNNSPEGHLMERLDLELKKIENNLKKFTVTAK